jgi:hypothetical protein
MAFTSLPQAAERFSMSLLTLPIALFFGRIPWLNRMGSWK